jgi:P27 family predicted phage terminase small subunit
MGKRGPRPKPSVVNGGAPANEPKPRLPKHLEPPEDLSEDAKTTWVETIEAIGHTGVITAVDLQGLRHYCEAAANFRRAQALVAQAGPLIKGRNGDLVRNPAAIIAKQASEAMRGWARELGLTPAARVGLAQKIEDGEHGDSARKLDAIVGAALIAKQMREHQDN